MITPAGDIQCWGNNDFGQLGDGTNTGSNLPVNVVGLSGGSKIVAGANHTCVLAGSSIWCWGQNDKGQVGDGSTTNRNKPVLVLSGAADVTAGADYTCGILSNGHAWCWGDNANGQLADGTKASHSLPALARLITGVSDVDGGQNETCALTRYGMITCWSGGGAGNYIGGLIPVTGGGPETNKLVEVNRFANQLFGLDQQGMPIVFDAGQFRAVNQLISVIQIDGGSQHVCALQSKGTIQCWGTNNFGQLGDNSTADSPIPVLVLNLYGASDMAVGANHTCAIVGETALNLRVQCWGLNTDGQLGDGTYHNSPVPVNVGGGE